MGSFTHWLRQSSEHYLMVDAQRQMAARYGLPAPPPPKGWRDQFWLGVFTPVYRRLPWRLRRMTIQLIPGSHRRTWTQPAVRGTRRPAVGPNLTNPVKPRKSDTTDPETGGD